MSVAGSKVINIAYNLSGYADVGDVTPPPPATYLHESCAHFEFNATRQRWWGLSEIFPDDVDYHPYKK
jgi:hypothetical protein